MIAWRKHPAGMRPVSNRAYPFAEHVLVDAERWIISKGLIEYYTFIIRVLKLLKSL